MGEVAGRIAFLRQQRKAKRSEPIKNESKIKLEDNSDIIENKRNKYRNSSWSDVYNATVMSRATPLHNNGRFLQTDHKLAAILDKSHNKRLNQQKHITWFDKFKRIHFREFNNKAAKYEFNKKKTSDDYLNEKKPKKYKQLPKSERMRYLKFFGRLFKSSSGKGTRCEVFNCEKHLQIMSLGVLLIHEIKISDKALFSTEINLSVIQMGLYV
ncbi:UBTF [Mytilus edulis]|uniref:UBTF n=1 Tax=Mytilus edulis TaxID=6550 RepID=A0A8S3QFB0_MYTED|nr:UBTF [Mytilus edulis]